MTDAPAPDRTLEQRRLLLEQVEGRLRIQFEEVDGLDRKATTVLAATGVTLGLVINNASTVATSPVGVQWFYYGALGLLAVALVAGVYALWPRHLMVVPEPKPLLEQHAGSLPEFTIGELVSTKAAAYERNVVLTKAKGDRVRLQMVLLALGGSLLVTAYVLERLV